MKIFIDESGNFRPSVNKSYRISCVGALVIPNRYYSEISECFNKLKLSWGALGEIKGSKLNEEQINETITFLDQYDVIFEIACIDANQEPDNSINEHRFIQAQKLTENIANLHPNVTKTIQGLRITLEGMPNQLYLQFTCMTQLIPKVIEHATLYYCQRKPAELKNFDWIIDAKESERVTKYEDWWHKILMPFLQSISFRRPFKFLEDGDYRYFKKFLIQTPAYIKPHISQKSLKNNTDKEAVNLNTILGKNINFTNSDKEAGLQLVDILTNAVCRAMNGNLEESGWGTINKLMIRKKPQNMTFITLNRDKSTPSRAYDKIFAKIGKGGKAMIKSTKSKK